MRRHAERCRTFRAYTRMYARTRMRARGFWSQENRFGRFGRFGTSGGRTASGRGGIDAQRLPTRRPRSRLWRRSGAWRQRSESAKGPPWGHTPRLPKWHAERPPASRPIGTSRPEMTGEARGNSRHWQHSLFSMSEPSLEENRCPLCHRPQIRICKRNDCSRVIGTLQERAVLYGSATRP